MIATHASNNKSDNKMNKKYAAALFVLTLLSACTAMDHMRWVGVGGSKADGVVILGFDVPPKMGVFETEVTYDAEQANAEADRRCRNWGYAGAEMFSDDFPVQVICHPEGVSPCWSKTYRIQYQCLDEKKQAE